MREKRTISCLTCPREFTVWLKRGAPPTYCRVCQRAYRRNPRAEGRRRIKAREAEYAN